MYNVCMYVCMYVYMYTHVCTYIKTFEPPAVTNCGHTCFVSGACQFGTGAMIQRTNFPFLVLRTHSVLHFYAAYNVKITFTHASFYEA